jgi:hypothetical protein
MHVVYRYGCNRGTLISCYFSRVLQQVKTIGKIPDSDVVRGIGRSLQVVEMWLQPHH